jgi:ADP-ribose pyrophosphatase YjhB (NUDIX family)
MSKFCYHCGNALSLGIPPGDDLLREYCKRCDYVHYQNPRILVSCIVHDDSHILWIKRGLEPRRGYWAVPAGFMECGESLQQAACRELFEETGLDKRPDDLQLCVVSSLAYINEVYIVFRCYHPRCALQAPSDEILALDFLAINDAPWQQLAYPDTENYMRDFYAQMQQQQFTAYLGQYSQHYRELKKML